MTASPTLAISRRMRLRGATDALHQSIDSRIRQTGFLTTQAGYVAYLRATLRARQAIEARLDASGAQAIYPPWPARKIAPALSLDISDLSGGSPEDVQCGPPPSPFSLGSIWGALYVLEGSAVGARLLLRQAAILGLTPQFGARHLACQATAPSAWKDFVAALDEVQLTCDQDAACVDGAITTFACFDRAYAQMNDS